MTEKSFGDYKPDNYNWITLGPAEYYPDAVALATQHYGPVLLQFQTLLNTATSSSDLYRKIMAVKGPTRTQLCRIFRKYISPSTPVEVLKVVKRTESNINGFQYQFRPIADARVVFRTRPMPDEILCTQLPASGIMVSDTRNQPVVACARKRSLAC